MKVGDLVKVKWANPTSKEKIGVLIMFQRFGGSEFAKVFHTNGYTGTYRSSALEVVSCKQATQSRSNTQTPHQSTLASGLFQSFYNGVLWFSITLSCLSAGANDFGLEATFRGINSAFKLSTVSRYGLATICLRTAQMISGAMWLSLTGCAFDLQVAGPVGVFMIAISVAKAVEPALRALAVTPQNGWLHVGPVGSGHFSKMIHNGIEYGMMESLAEGLELLKGKEEFGIDIAKVTELWRHGSVVRSWLLDLTAEALQGDQNMDTIAPFVADSGEGRWTVVESIEQGIPAPVLTLALQVRFRSQERNQKGYGYKLLSIMRNAFGGHAMKRKS